MRLWTKLLLRDPKSSTQEARADRLRLEEDKSDEEPAIASQKTLSATGMTPGSLCMYLLHAMLTTGRSDFDFQMQKRNLL